MPGGASYEYCSLEPSRELKRHDHEKRTVMPKIRALTPLFGNGAGAFRVGKNSVVLTKIGKNTKFYALNSYCQTDLTYMVLLML